MTKTIAVRWHSRAGQGAITASAALAEILGKPACRQAGHGKEVQSFPDFGAEKRGAPVVVFNRISAKSKLVDVSHPRTIDAVVLLDTTLIASCEVTLAELLQGLQSDGILLVNTAQKSLKVPTSAQVFSLDASAIAVREIGKDIPNVPILGALVNILKLAESTDFAKELEQYLSVHLPPEVVQGNLQAFRRGFDEVSKIKRNGKADSSDRKRPPGWQQTPSAGTINAPGNSRDYNTGNWVRESCEWNEKTCIKCNLCWPVCPHDAIKIDAQGEMDGVDTDKCTACALCVGACPTKPNSLKIIPKSSSPI